MQASNTASAGFSPAYPARMNPRVVSVTVTVVAIHLALLAVVMIARNDPMPRALESRTITDELLNPAPVAAPAAIQSTPTPTPPKPIPQVKPKVQPRPKPAPTPLPVAAAPSQHEIAAPAPAPPAPPARA